MGKKSRLRMLGDSYLSRVKGLPSDAIEKIRTVSEEKKAEARANTDNFSRWWAETYPDEFTQTNDEVKRNKNIPQNMARTLKRMNQWRHGLKYEP